MRILSSIVESRSDGYDLALGQTRLSILDLSPGGHQPMSTPDGSVRITFNGEVYNFQDLRRELESRGHSFRTGTDTEVILRPSPTTSGAESFASRYHLTRSGRLVRIRSSCKRTRPPLRRRLIHPYAVHHVTRCPAAKAL